MNRLHISSRHVGLVLGSVVGFGALMLAAFSLLYAGKMYPGVTVDGIYVGGMSEAKAKAQIAADAKSYASQQLPVEYGSTTLNIPVHALGVTYDETAVQAGLKYGRQGSMAEQIKARLRAMVGRPSEYASFHYANESLAPFVAQIEQDVNRPVANAQLRYGDDLGVEPSQPGTRFDQGRLMLAVNQALAHMSTVKVAAVTYPIKPSIDTATLTATRSKADRYVSAPLELTAGSLTRTVDQNTILSWVDVSTPAGHTDRPSSLLYSFYPVPAAAEVNLSLNATKVGAYMATMASGISKTPKNAVLAMQDGKLTVVQASQQGAVLDQPKAVQQIVAALGKDGSRAVQLPASTTQPEVSEDKLDGLGIKELISEGQTFFPGSSADRLTNVRVGAAKYNSILLKPGETFSFGKILGDVGPAQGYVPELVILGDHEEKQYGGGLCQVASTAYRAALLAGLPILERHNHSFAVSYYTAPYGVPGVDATIYYPQVDFKFKNDTGSYILIQTIMRGTTLTFDYYGTKTKYGEIRGPQFISGTTDATQPSHTVFWRDVKKMDGSLIKTDTVNTHYEPSTKFPIQKQFN